MKAAVEPMIRLTGVRQNNLKNFNLDLPLGRLVVITGLSGSGKSSLAFDTLFAEGQRRYIETFSPYARQFFDRMDKPRVDRIDGIPPAIAIEQRNAVKTTRSTVGTMTDVCEYMKVLWPHLARLYCRQCGAPVGKDSPGRIEEVLGAAGVGPGTEVLITFDLPLSDRLSLEDSLTLIGRQGYRRILLEDEPVRIDEAAGRFQGGAVPALTVVQDRLRPTRENRARFSEACEHAYHFGKGKLAVRGGGRVWRFSEGLHCASCDLEYREATPAMFSFNHPMGACPFCRGFGRSITIDYDLAIPDWSRTLGEGVVKPWWVGHGLESQRDLLKFCKKRKVPLDVPFSQLPAGLRDWVIDGDPDYGVDKDHEWPRAWYGVKGYFRWLESKAYKMHVRVMLSRYRSYVTCPECQGRRFQPQSLLFQADGPDGRLTLADFYQFTVTRALRFIREKTASQRGGASDPVTLALSEVCSRLSYLVDVGLGYLTLDRPTRTLSGGETERVNLTTCLGTRLVNTLFVLDEPSVGLHQRDMERLVGVLTSLRDGGNTVVVVEHESNVMRAADQIVDLGPGHGESGGEVVFQGTFPEILRHPRSLTGHYLSGAKSIEVPKRRPAGKKAGWLRVRGVTLRNLNDVTVELPLGRLVCLTGVSGSGKTTLAREVLLPALEAHFKSGPVDTAGEEEEAADDPADVCPDSEARVKWSSLEGQEQLTGVVLVDQSSLGKTPRSNPAVYTGAFKELRALFAQTELARQRGLNASAFSFNSGQGQCERCRGAGFEKIEMQFLSDVYVRCADCDGRRYRDHILEITLRASLPEAGEEARTEWSIADLLDATVDEAILLLLSFYHLAAGRRALESLKLLQEVGLGYLRLGQPINTLSGGESQRLKLVRHLADFSRGETGGATLFLFDEPTTGLHYEDVRVLLKAFQRLVDSGHSLLVIEHNLEVIKCADWVVDLGPEAGAEGGTVVAAGTPEKVARCRRSHTGASLAAMGI